jgi:hypothetical protein
MRPPVAVVVMAAVLAGTPAGRARQQTPPTGRQVFRASADVVSVDVSVHTNGSRVGGLSAKDFVVLDNGVRQQIDTIESSVVPVDVTILVDTDAEVADLNGDVNKQATRIASMLRPIDRLRVWNVDTVVSEVVPLAAAGPHPSLPPMGHGGLAPVNDAIAAALMEPVAPDARHLVIAITNGIDTDSVLGLATVREIAARTNATLHVSQIDVVEPDLGLWVTSAEDLRIYECSVVHHCEPTHLFWQPHYAPPRGPERFAPLTAIAQATGGDLHTLGLFVEHNAADVFSNAFRDFQTNYVLRYTPRGVTPAGWHTIAVTTPAYPGYQIRARHGYSMDGGGMPAPDTALPREATSAVAKDSAPLRTDRLSEVEKVMGAYAHADYATTFAVIHQIENEAALVRAVRSAGNVWPAAPHREAVFALELAQVVLSSQLTSQNSSARTAATDWLAAEGRLVRPALGPDAFEHEWLATELDLLEGPVDPSVAQPFVIAALRRFPDDPGFLLAGAIVADQRWPLGTENVMTSSQADRQLADVAAKYDAVIAHVEAPSVVVEARVRQAWLLHRVKQDERALAQLDAVREVDADPAIRFLRQLFRGHVLGAMGRAAEAVNAYRAAVTILPGAQSARVALMNGLVAVGDRAGALALSETIQTTPSRDLDPWHLYWQGDYRRFPEAIARLRELVR